MDLIVSVPGFTSLVFRHLGVKGLKTAVCKSHPALVEFKCTVNPRYTDTR